MTNDDERGEGGKKCRKFDDVICERPLKPKDVKLLSKIALCTRMVNNLKASKSFGIQYSIN